MKFSWFTTNILSPCCLTLVLWHLKTAYQLYRQWGYFPPKCSQEPLFPGTLAQPLSKQNTGCTTAAYHKTCAQEIQAIALIGSWFHDRIVWKCVNREHETNNLNEVPADNWPKSTGLVGTWLTWWNCVKAQGQGTRNKDEQYAGRQLSSCIPCPSAFALFHHANKLKQRLGDLSWVGLEKVHVNVANKA